MRIMPSINYSATNWNEIEDEFDKQIWDMLVKQFWIDTRMPVSKDLSDWNNLSQAERDLFIYVFGGLTLLDTLQSESGIDALKEDVQTKHEEAVLNNILFMEAVHTKSYSSIFSTLATSREIDEVFEWIKTDELLQQKAEKIDKVYKEGSPLERKIASVFLESFLFYSGFYTPLLYAGTNKMINTGEVISLIIRDEAIHGFYIGYKFQQAMSKLTDEERQATEDWAYTFLYELYEIEKEYTDFLYKDLGMEDDVRLFLQYNANKALSNLGLSPLFPNEGINPVVETGMNTGTLVHDFFSSVGNSYQILEVEEMSDEDYSLYTK